MLSFNVINLNVMSLLIIFFFNNAEFIFIYDIFYQFKEMRIVLLIKKKQIKQRSLSQTMQSKCMISIYLMSISIGLNDALF